MLKNIFALCISLFLTLAIAEASFRLLELSGAIPPGGVAPEDPKEYMKTYSAKRVKSTNPLLVSELDKNDTRVNSIGIRDREFQKEKPAGTLRIATIGDSVTFGLGVPSEKTFPKILEKKTVLFGAKVEVMNFGISAYDTIAELELYKTSASQYNPDIVILTYIINDPMRPGVAIEKLLSDSDTNNKKSFRDITISMLTLSLDKLSSFSHLFRWINHLYKKIITGFISEGLYHSIYENKTIWEPTATAITGFAKETQKNHHKLIVVAFPLLLDFKNYPYSKEHQKAVDAFEQHGVPVLDMLPLLANETPEKFRLNADDQTHPNEYGHQYIADAIIQFMENSNLLPPMKTTNNEVLP